MQWHLSRQLWSWWQLSISGISHWLVNLFWPNLKGMFLGPSSTDANCHSDICSGNICPCDICPYQLNLSCYWPYFDQTFGTPCFAAISQLSRDLCFPQKMCGHVFGGGGGPTWAVSSNSLITWVELGVLECSEKDNQLLKNFFEPQKCFQSVS